MSGFSAFKLVQLGTGGSIEISFGNEELTNKEKIRSIKKPAVWTGHEIEVYMTERMQSSTLFSSVITPLAVSKVLKKINIGAEEMGAMTRMEKAGAFRKVCRKTRSDAIVILESLGGEVDMSYFSFNRMNTSTKARMILYGCQLDTTLYQSVTDIKINMGSTVPNEHEVAKIAGEAIAEKLIQLIEGKEPAVTDNPTEVAKEEGKEKKPNFDFLKGIFSGKSSDKGGE